MFKSEPEHVINVDETGITTVTKTQKYVITQKDS
jgi:hypothetical protein